MEYTNKQSIENSIDKNECKYYMYRHINKKSRLPFYIGIGSKDLKAKSLKTEYERAYSFKKRNNEWKKIVENDGYEIQIMLESNDYNYLKQKEKEFISEYGRKVISENGLLVNITHGGDGGVGYKFTEEQKNKISKAIKEVYVNGFESKNIKKVIDTRTKVIYKSLSEAAINSNMSLSYLSGMLNGIYKNKTPMIYLEKYNGDEIIPDDSEYRKKIINTKTKEIYKGITDLHKRTGLDLERMNLKLKNKVPNDTYFCYLHEYDINPVEMIPEKKQVRKFIIKNILDGKTYNSRAEVSRVYGLSIRYLQDILDGKINGDFILLNNN